MKKAQFKVILNYYYNPIKYAKYHILESNLIGREQPEHQGNWK